MEVEPELGAISSAGSELPQPSARQMAATPQRMGVTVAWTRTPRYWSPVTFSFQLWTLGQSPAICSTWIQMSVLLSAAVS